MAAEPEPAPAPADEEEEDDDDLLGFNLFEGETPKIVREFNDLGGGISLSVTCLDEEPIGVQSGQLLWPAAPALCRHLIASWESLRGVSAAAAAAGAERGREQAVLELGAGCGMVGITAAKLGCSRVVMTDRDLGALELIEQNVSAAEVDASCTVLPLSWHAHAKARPTAESTGAASGGGSGSNDGGLAEHAVVLQAAAAGGEGEAEGQQGYPLIVAADVIYALEVVSMLFGSVNTLLATVPTAAGEEVSAPAPLFLMCQSFGYDDATEAEIDRCSVAAGLRREVLIDQLQLQEDEEEVEGGAVKIQAFTREPPPALA